MRVVVATSAICLCFGPVLATTGGKVGETSTHVKLFALLVVEHRQENGQWKQVACHREEPKS